MASGMNIATISVIGVFLAGVCGGCAAKGPPAVIAVEQRTVEDCTYIDTITHIADMGAFQIHPKFADNGRQEVLRRAESLNATHVVWVAAHPSGAAALAYRCGD